MPKLAVLLLSLLFTNALTAQFGLRAGVTGGTTYGPSEQISGDKVESFRPALGYQIGVAGRVASLTERLSVSAELNYEVRRSAVDVNFNEVIPDASRSLNGSIKDRYDYVTLPVLLTLAGKGVDLYAGPGFSYLVRARRRIDLEGEDQSIAGSTPFSAGEEVDLLSDDRYTNAAIRRLCLSLNAGAMLSLSDRLRLDIRLYHTLTDVSEDREDRTVYQYVRAGIPFPTRDDGDRTVGVQASLVFRL